MWKWSCHSSARNIQRPSTALEIRPTSLIHPMVSCVAWLPGPIPGEGRAAPSCFLGLVPGSSLPQDLCSCCSSHPQFRPQIKILPSTSHVSLWHTDDWAFVCRTVCTASASPTGLRLGDGITGSAFHSPWCTRHLAHAALDQGRLSR